MVDRPGDERGLDAMCEGIVLRYHASLQRSLARIDEALDAAASSAPSASMIAVRHAFSELAAQVRAHLAKEENLVFPAIEALAEADRAGKKTALAPFVTVLHPIRALEGEHMRIEQVVDQLREATRLVDAPESLSPAWRDAMVALSHLEADLRELHQTENEVLFPRALDLERRVL
jgi:regulator of cell morphogenesis and NO signaling